MNWTQRLIDRLDAAFNESSVRGFSFDRDQDEARLLVEVSALPESGPVDSDFRRVIVMSGVSLVEITLREDPGADASPVLPLASLDELAAFFARLSFAHSMYGWAFVDIADPNVQWQVEPSLRVNVRQSAGSHSLRWSTECGIGTDQDGIAFYLQGLVRFDELRVERADGTPVPIEEFAAAGVRWWRAFEAGDSRLSPTAQADTFANAQLWWPDRSTLSTIIPASEWDESSG